MAVKASFEQHSDRVVYLDLYPGERRIRAHDDPEVPGYEWTLSVLFFFDNDKMDNGIREFLGLTIFHIEHLNDEDLRAIQYLDVPLVDISERGLYNVAVTDVLRHARDQALISMAD